jgi:hypothetical protein
VIGVPVISDVTFRVSADGAMIGVDFECRDGQTVTVALPVADLSKMLAGFLWAGDESALRRFPDAPEARLRDVLRDGARPATDWRIIEARGEQFLEVSVGAAHLCVRLPKGG